MVGLSGLWMPIVVSAVFVFIMSSLIHMVLGWHKSEYPAPPNQDALGDALRPFNLPPGEYMLPRAGSMKEMGEPAFVEKLKKGPVMMLNVYPNGPLSMGKQLFLWFLYAVAISVFVAYVTGRTNGQGAAYLTIFRVSGAVAFAGYALGQWQNWIWYKHGTQATIMNTVDGLLYALLVGGTFGWLWPR